jgi:hypothetical protein
MLKDVAGLDAVRTRRVLKWARAMLRAAVQLDGRSETESPQAGRDRSLRRRTNAQCARRSVSTPWEWRETTDQLRTTTAELSAPQRSIMDTSEQWFTVDNRGGPIWGSRGREFKSRQPD